MLWQKKFNQLNLVVIFLYIKKNLIRKHKNGTTWFCHPTLKKNVFWLESMNKKYFQAAFCNLPVFLFGTALLYGFFMNHRITDHIWNVYLVYLWPGYLSELRILSWTMPHTSINCILGPWGGMQHKWYQGSKSCLIYFCWNCGQDVLSRPGK